MNDSLRLSVPDLADPAQREGFWEVADAAIDVDGVDPFNEQTRLDVVSGRRTPIVATAWSQDEHGRAVGAAVVGRGELDLVVHPLFRGMGYGEIAVRGLLSTARGALTAWSHGDHPAARILADHHGFAETRTLYKLRLGTLPPATEGAREGIGDSADPAGVRIEELRPGTDDEEEWVALNALIFAGHPEQGRMTVEDLRAREAESWFDAGDFLVARDASGAMVGYNWLKIAGGVQDAGNGGRIADGGPGGSGGRGRGPEGGEPREGEIYVVGVHPDLAGRGLGRTLMRAGLDRLARRGCRSAVLYVDGSNSGAMHLYRSLGFGTQATDVQYTRAVPSD